MSSYLMNELIWYILFYIIMYWISFMIMMGGKDWMSIWIGLEINMMSFIMLIYYQENIECCLKYFFVQSLGSGIFLSVLFVKINMIYEILSMVLVYKIGGGPFYFWFPSVCSGLTWGGIFLLMTIQKIAPLMLLSCFLSSFYWWMILISLVGGAYGAFNQVSLKKLMAFSSVHHTGWMMISIQSLDIMWWVYLILYSFMIMGVIFYFLKKEVSKGLLSNGDKWCIVIGLLGMGGMPPFVGFFLKWWLFSILIQIDYMMLGTLVVLSVIMFYVYFRIGYYMVMGGLSCMGWLKNVVLESNGKSNVLFILVMVFVPLSLIFF